jgi:putative transposase
VVDTFSRYVPVLDPRHRYRGEDVVQTLERVCRQVGYPKTIRVDQGTEFVSRDLDLWAYARGVTLDFSRPGKPTDNAFNVRRDNRSTGSIVIPSSPSMAASGRNA